MNVEIRSEAHVDIAAGVAFYDRQGFGAGDHFYRRIFEDIESLSESIASLRYRCDDPTPLTWTPPRASDLA